MNSLKSNSVIEPGTVGAADQNIFFVDWTESRGEQLSLKDWKKNPLLEKQIHRLDYPVYFTYYCSADGKLPGFLLFTQTQVEWRSVIPDAILDGAIW